MFEQLRNLGRSVKTGFNRGVELQDYLAREKSANKNVKKRYSHSVIPGS